MIYVYVYRDTVDGSSHSRSGKWRWLNKDGTDQDNLCQIKMKIDDVERFFKEKIKDTYALTFKEWLDDYCAEDTDELYQWILNNNIEHEIIRDDGIVLPYDDIKKDKCVREQKLMENAICITDHMHGMLERKEIKNPYECSTYMTPVWEQICDWAREFEDIYGNKDIDYIEKMDSFARNKLKKYYGIKKYRCVQVSVDVIIPEECDDYEKQIESAINNQTEFSVAGCVFVCDMSEQYKDLIEETEDFNN